MRANIRHRASQQADDGEALKSPTDIAVIGSNMVDLISYVPRLPADGETLEAPDFSMGCGGKGANQAVAAARSGATVVMVTRIGDDLFGKKTRDNLAANGINVDFVMETPETTSGVAPIFVDPAGRNRILIIKGANAALSPNDVEAARGRIASSRLVVLQLEIPLETVYATVSLAREEGVPVLLNPAPAHPDLDLDRLAGVDYLVPNESELALLTGLPANSLDEIRDAARTLLERGFPHVIVTLGEHGTLWLNRAEEHVVPAQPVRAIDTTGAGDAFIGAFCRELTHSGDVMAALQAGNRYAGISVTRRGTQTSYPTVAELVAGNTP